MLRALGNPVRLAITLYIKEHPGCIGNDLVIRFGRAQATISQHLAVLRQAEIVECERDGHAVCYAINEEAMELLKGQIVELATQLRRT